MWGGIANLYLKLNDGGEKAPYIWASTSHTSHYTIIIQMQ